MKDRTSILSELSIENDVKWEPDGKICKLCQQKFGYLQNRRHHCRTCGILICENCSFFKDVMLLNNTSTKKIRLCAECIDKYNLEEKQRTVNAATTNSVVIDNNTIELLPTVSPLNSPYKNPNEIRMSLLSIASYTPEIRLVSPLKDISLDEIQTIPLTDEKQKHHQQITLTTKSLSILDADKEQEEEENRCELFNCELFQFWK